MSCKHVVSGTGRPGYRGMECCPYCGAYELMFTQFQPVDPEDFKKNDERLSREKSNQ